jgi:hypothetical protein
VRIQMGENLGRPHFPHFPSLSPPDPPERALRPAVIRRKVSHCSKTEPRARAFEAFLSVIQTYKQQSPTSVSQQLFNLFSSSGPAPPS